MRSLAILSAGPALSQMLTALGAILVARGGGAQGFGVLSAGLGVVALGSDVIDMGTGTFVSRELAGGRWSTDTALRVLFQRMSLYLLAAVIAAACIGIWSPTYEVLLLMLDLYLVTFAWSLSLSCLARAVGAYLATSLAAVTERLVLLGLVGVAYSQGYSTADFFAYGLVAGTGISSAVLYFGALRRRLEPGAHQPAPLSLRRLYRASVTLGVSGIATDLQNLEAPLVAAGSGVIGAGIYSSAARLSGPMTIPASAAAAMILRENAEHKGDRRAARGAALHYWWVIASYGVGTLSVALLSPQIVHTVLGHAFGNETVRTLRIVCATVFFAAANQIVYTALLAIGLEHRLARSLWCCVPAGLALTFAGAIIGGPVAAAVGGLLAQAGLLLWLGTILFEQDDVMAPHHALSIGEPK